MIDFSDSSGISNEQAFGFPVLPKDTYLMKIASLKEERTGPNSKHPGALMAALEFRVVEGAETGDAHAGIPFYTRIVLGGEGDLDADDPKTVDTKGGLQYRLIVGRAGYVPGPREGELSTVEQLARIADQITGNELRLKLSVRRSKEVLNGDGSVKYEARDENRIDGVFARGGGDVARQVLRPAAGFVGTRRNTVAPAVVIEED
jgi:hypothetical protein